MSEEKSTKVIPVKALRDGQYGGQIRVEGSKFNVKSEQDLGSWMHRLDGGVNPQKDKHIKVASAVKDKKFVKIDESKLLSESDIKTKAEKEVASAHADAGEKIAEEAKVAKAATKVTKKVTKKAVAKKAPAVKKVVAAVSSTEGLI